MEIKEILKKVDHTLLKPEADWPQIKTLCDEGIRYGVARRLYSASFRAAGQRICGKFAENLYRRGISERV